MEELTLSSTLSTPDDLSNNTKNSSSIFILQPEYRDCMELYGISLGKDTFAEDLEMCNILTLVSPIIIVTSIVIGFPGNFLAIVTVLTFPLSAPNFYVMLLAVGDLIALTLRTIDYVIWIYKLQAFIRGGFWTTFYLTIIWFGGIFPNWVLVIICLERFIAIRFPLHARTIFTLRNAKISGLVLSVLVIVMIITISLTMELDLSWYVAMWISATYLSFYGLLPSSLIMIGTILIIVELQKARKRRELMHSNVTGRSSVTNNKVTLMMILVAMTFLILITPLCLISIVMMYGIFNNRVALSYAVASHLAYLSHAVNFYLYVLSSVRFRQHLLNLLMCKKRNGTNRVVHAIRASGP